MALLRLEQFGANDRDRLGGNIQGFDVYGDQDEKIGRIVDILIDETNYFRYLVVSLDTWIASKQILLPLTSHQVDYSRQRVYVNGLNRAHVAEMPAYRPSGAVGDTHETSRYETSRQEYHYPGSVEVSSPLETSMPLDSPKVVNIVSPSSSSVPVSEPNTPIAPINQAPDQRDVRSEQVVYPEQNVYPRPSAQTPDQWNQATPRYTEPTPRRVTPQETYSQPERRVDMPSTHAPKITAEETIQLLDERLVVNPNKRKIGEVIVRKEIETQIVEVPIRREKLIVEQVTPEYKRLAVVDLGDNDRSAKELLANVSGSRPTISRRFTSAKAASQFLEDIANQPNSDFEQVQVTIVRKDAAQ